ncbi:MAG TPA: molybdenum cofactor biosynthesis protein MoaE [Anaeromyxobacteraceae bacterium]|nr:molybdenum cofactor biosynthesis protein MoaE [Anaeromyxobacteraceae bacterium]
MALTVLYFAAAREAAGTERETLEAAPATVADLRRLLVERHPGLARVLVRCRIALDQRLAEEADAVPPVAEVAVIPPVAGGAPLFRVVDRPLDLAEVVAAVSGAGRGGIVTFTGTVRGESHGRRVLRLEYEAHRPMAERVLADIGRAVEAEHGAAVAVVHRVGVLEPGEAAVVIAAAAAHRTPAFRACEAVIERLKKDAPIWKREVYEDGSEWVGLGP